MNKLAQTAVTTAKFKNNDKHSFVCNLKMHILLSASVSALKRFSH